MASRSAVSQRQAAEGLGIPRSTLQSWLVTRDSVKAHEKVVEFFESPEGVAVLHQIVLAVHFVVGLLCPGGIRLVCTFLELSGLAAFVAMSFGAQRRVAVDMEKATVAFGQAEAKRLGEGMTPKEVTLCQDETFHPQPCLVAIEPVSNYILLESYAPDRKADTWSQYLCESLGELSVRIVQSTSDEGRGILHHVREDLGAHHSPDLFHVQSDCHKATSVPLAAQRKREEQALQKASDELRRCGNEAKPEGPVGSGGPHVGDQRRLEEAMRKESEARQSLETARTREQQAKEAIRAISTNYHPYDLETGAAKAAKDVEASLVQSFREIEEVAEQAGLSAACRKRIEKAQRVVEAMVATIAFYWLVVTAKVATLSLPQEAERALYSMMIPGIYLGLVAKKARDCEQKKKLSEASTQLLDAAWNPSGPLACLDANQVVLVKQVARECAEVFQRSSSCVEGRNGQLSLHHHGLHRLSGRKLSALTCVHNYYIKRRDKTTAAERLFGARPKDLFSHLLANVDLPGRPARKRSPATRETNALAVAA